MFSVVNTAQDRKNLFDAFGSAVAVEKATGKEMLVDVETVRQRNGDNGVPGVGNTTAKNTLMVMVHQQEQCCNTATVTGQQYSVGNIEGTD